ncbi:MAG: DNA repair protein RecN [Deltaproteobacteria bacterium]|nr:DNA repair protein RecN [Deltaproteobacteria bacterium]|tara:strand:+ start:23830 stop:25653 length:1824 start_codon:yes stop_codon:yes gene_type:complete
MLLELNIKNLAIIESVEIRFGQGLNVLTGETGAGKSILLAALNLVLGGRSDRSLVRHGCKEAWAEALFDVEPSLLPLLADWGIEAEEDEPLALRRVVQNNGRSRAYINCVSVPASLLRQLATRIIDFGRQHDQSILMNAENHIDLLDRYAQAKRERAIVEQRYNQLSQLFREKKQLEETRQERAERVDFLHYQSEAITELDPQPGEDKQLEEKLQALQQCEKRQQLAQRASAMLDNEGNSVRDALAAALDPISDLSGLDEEVESFHDDLQNALMLIEETARSLRSYGRNQHFDRQEMQEVRERLDQLLKLQERFGGDLTTVIQRLDDIEEELEELAALQQREHTLEEEIEDAQRRLLEAVGPLSRKRQKAAASLADKVEKELADLAMPGARICVRFFALRAPDGLAWELDEDDTFEMIDGCEQPSEKVIPLNAELENEEEDVEFVRIASWGAERGYFYLAANEGEEMYPLERVASGGELSRILLALKRVLAGASSVQAFVFDEIDSGVAGAAATMVAKKLREIASQNRFSSQIICISHTPQIAAEADHHFHVRKQTQRGRTRSRVVPLLGDERVYEIARMLAGDQSMDSALELARKLVLPPPVALAS